MASAPFLQDALFQLNLLIWLSWPSRPGVYPLFRLHAERDEAGGQPGHFVAGFTPADRFPLVVHRVPVGDVVRSRLDPVEEHPAH